MTDASEGSRIVAALLTVATCQGMQIGEVAAAMVPGAHATRGERQTAIWTVYQSYLRRLGDDPADDALDPADPDKVIQEGQTPGVATPRQQRPSSPVAAGKAREGDQW